MGHGGRCWSRLWCRCWSVADGEVGVAVVPCADCPHWCAPRSAWDRFTFRERDAFKQAGVRRAAGRGLCSRCYELARLEGRLDGAVSLMGPADRSREGRVREWVRLRQCGLSTVEVAGRLGVTVKHLRRVLREAS